MHGKAHYPIMHRNPALRRQFQDIDSGLSYGHLTGPVQPLSRPLLILFVTEDFRIRPARSPNATPPGRPHAQPKITAGLRLNQNAR